MDPTAGAALPPDQAIIGILSAAILGALKLLGPQVQKQIPGFIWPLAVLVLARLGTALCHTVGAACTGNPLSWSAVDTSILATGFVAIVAREATVWGKGYMTTILAWIQKHIPGAGGAASSIFALAILAMASAALAASPTPFEPLATASGAADVFCGPQPGAAYTACYAWTYQPDPGEKEPWRAAGVCLYRDSDKIPTIPQNYGGEYWFECVQYCNARYAAHCQANATPTTGYRGSCHAGCSSP